MGGENLENPLVHLTIYSLHKGTRYVIIMWMKILSNFSPMKIL
jgi:hypothetical protein